MTRLPFAPLMAAVERGSDRPTLNGQHTGADRAAAAALGVSRRTVIRWRQRGLTWDVADRVACSLGLHPASVWDEWFGVDDEAVA